MVFRTWVYASKPLEIEWCSTNLTSGLLMPMPKLMVHTITWGAGIKIDAHGENIVHSRQHKRDADAARTRLACTSPLIHFS